MTHSVSSPQAEAGAEPERSAQGVRSRRERLELAEPAFEEASPR